MSATTVATTRDRVGWGDLAWITWRQHRLMLVGTTVLALGGAAVMVGLGLYAGSAGDARVRLPAIGRLSSNAEMLVASMTAFGALVAVFWAAPLLSREYEQGTHLLAWSQDVAASRWMIGKAVVLAVVSVALAVVLGIVSNLMMHQVNAVSTDYPTFGLFNDDAFEAVPVVQAGHVLFGFALGLAISAISRRTVLSMGLTFGVFLVVRLGIAQLARPYYQTPVRATTPIGSQGGFPTVVDHTLYVDGGMLDASGTPIDYSVGCQDGYTANYYYDCMRRAGAVSNFRDFQPADRLGTFQLIEFGIYTVLAAALFVVAWRAVHRITRL